MFREITCHSSLFKSMRPYRASGISFGEVTLEVGFLTWQNVVGESTGKKRLLMFKCFLYTTLSRGIVVIILLNTSYLNGAVDRSVSRYGLTTC